jgi:uracil-DNA glycosylase family 4
MKAKKEELMEALREEVMGCGWCGLCQGASRKVMGEGDLDAAVVLVGEAPGRKEDELGRPFVGSAGKLLDRMLEDAGLTREGVYITNVVNCRPPNNRKPKGAEVEACSGHLERILGIIRPRVVAPMGNSAIEYFFKKFDLKKIKIGDAHGKPVRVRFPWGDAVLFPLYHPAAAIYNRRLLGELEDDVARLKRVSGG